jgi:putative bacteriocin precursor
MRKLGKNTNPAKETVEAYCSACTCDYECYDNSAARMYASWDVSTKTNMWWS